jgi:hypothetical protein
MRAPALNGGAADTHTHMIAKIRTKQETSSISHLVCVTKRMEIHLLVLSGPRNF